MLRSSARSVSKHILSAVRWLAIAPGDSSGPRVIEITPMRPRDLSALELDRVREHLAGFARSAAGKEACLGLEPTPDRHVAEQRIEHGAQTTALVERQGRPPLDRRYPLGPGRAVDEDRHFLREDNGWGRSLRQLEVIEAAASPGDHDGFILEPAASGWADALRRRLREAPD